jgi:hypothetical protein
MTLSANHLDEADPEIFYVAYDMRPGRTPYALTDNALGPMTYCDCRTGKAMRPLSKTQHRSSVS